VELAPRSRRGHTLPLIWSSCWPPCWPIALSPGSGRAPGPPPYLPHPGHRLPRLVGWCGLVENGAYEGCPFPTLTDAPRRLPAPHPGRPGAGFLRCPAITATPYRFSPATRSAAAWPSDALTYSGVEVEVAGCLLPLC
jgi:hypothetical protein